jgi:hypothetical protein
MPDPALEAMRAQLDAAHAAAERLVAEAQARADEHGDPALAAARRAAAAEEAARAHAEGVPPRGWESRRAAGERGPLVPELQTIVGLLELARASVPPELSRQVLEALREFLVALRALIDWYLDRLDRPAPSPAQFEDIPIE